MKNEYQEVDQNSSMDAQYANNDQNINQNQYQDINNANQSMNNQYQDINNADQSMNNQYQDINNVDQSMNNQYQDINNVDQSMNNQYQDTNNGYQPVNDQYQTDETNTSSSFEYTGKSKKSIIKWALIILGIIIIAIIIFFIIRGCSNKNPGNENSPKTSLYNEIVASSKTYFQQNRDKLPDAYGSCTQITLADLKNKNLINSNNELLDTCDEDKTTIKVCKLESGTYHYTVTFSSTSDSLKQEYNDWKEGTESNLSNESDVKFTFLIKKTEDVGDINNIAEEEFLDGEIPYKEGEYVITSQKELYRYREKSYSWYVESNLYYPNDVNAESKVNSYYTKAPNSEYSNKGAAATVYKWFIGSNLVYDNGAFYSEQPDQYYLVKGVEGTPVVTATTDSPEVRSYRTIKNTWIYRLRKLESTDKVTNIDYYCVNSTTGYNWVSHDIACDDDLSGEVGTATATQYKCYWKNNVTGKTSKSETWQKTTCEDRYYYVNEAVNEGYDSTWLAKDCGYNSNAKPYLCDRRQGYVYTDRVWRWYTPSTKTYFKDSNGNDGYFKQSPSSQAIKDSTTETTAYAWYKTVRTTIGVSLEKPQNNALRGDVVYGAWSDYSETPFEATNTRETASTIKYTIKRTATENTKWTNISDDYLTEEETIKFVKDQGYEVSSLQDILNIPELKYDIKLFYRNEK